MASPPPPVRRVCFDHPDDFDPRWHPRLPEFAIGANAVSLQMPHAEPFVVRAVRGVLPRLDGDLATRAEAYVRQEAQHHREHHRYNRLLAARYRGLGPLDRALAATFGFFERHCSPRFALAYATGFESVAYSSARWVARHRQDLLTGADPQGADLFVWHLAEEVEHKAVAHDVWTAVDGSRWRLALGTLAAMVLLALFTVTATVVMLAQERRLLHPLAHWRLGRWTIGLTFTLLPDVAMAMRRDHHPDDLPDPTWYRVWLAELDSTHHRVVTADR